MKSIWIKFKWLGRLNILFKGKIYLFIESKDGEIHTYISLNARKPKGPYLSYAFKVKHHL